MSDPINSDTIINSSLSDINDNVISEKSVFAGKACTDDDVGKWSIVHFETDEEEDVESFNDLIPSSWITTMGKLCWYPMNKHQATIHKLVKQCAKANSEWNCFSIKKIEEDIETYDRGMKMLVKISKNPNATLYSDIEEKGKGKRLKKPIKHFDDSDKENNLKKGRNVQSMLPPLPKLMNMSKSVQANHPLPDKIDKMIKQSCVDKASSSSDNEQKPISAYTLERKVTLESLADAIRHLNAEVLSCKLTLRKIDRNVESFLETETMAKKPTIENISTAVHILDEFPITNMEDLQKIERKLKKDETFRLKLIDALHLGAMGQSLQKKVNSVLRMVFDDKLASLFNWKGQRGAKLKLSKRRIAKIMLEAVSKEFPTINETTFGRKAGPWLAQATFRIKKNINKNDEAADDNHRMTSSNDEDSSQNSENSDEDDKNSLQ